MEILIAIGIILLISYVLYSGLIKKKNQVFESLSGVDVQLKKRSNLIPNILKIAQKFMEHEKELMTEVTKLREHADADYDKNKAEEIKQHIKNEKALSHKMGQIMVKLENYPDLKSNETMVQAQQSYNEVEAQIAAARRFYNSAVKDFNNAVEIFPSSLFAKMLNLNIMPFYEADEASKQNIDASDFLK